MDTLRESAIILWSTPVYAVLILAELIFSNIRHRPVYTLQNTLENVALTLLNGSIDLVMRGFSLVVLTFFYEQHISTIVDPIVYWLLLLIALDFMFYILHVVDHKCRLFWAIHVTHHSSEEFNLTVGFRSSVFQPLYRFIYFIPLAWLGFQPLDILFVYSATQVYGILLHTKYVGNLGPLEWILVTPSHHRVHHASNAEYIDKNMGMLFIVWDRLFGTFQPEKGRVRYGITKPLINRKLPTVLFHEWYDLWRDVRQTKSLREAFVILMGPPGRPPRD